MNIKLFILGRPGTGKSYAARYFELDVKIRDGSSYRINDYKHLRQQFILDKDHIRFEPVGDKGFNILDRSALNKALVEVIKEAKARYEAQLCDLIMIEFARPNYDDSLREFGNEFLHDAFFLFIDADLDTCYHRIKYRATHPQFLDDDIFLSRDALYNFYGDDNKSYMPAGLIAEFGLQDWQVRCIDNTGSIEEFEAQLSEFIQAFQDRIGQSPETDPVQSIPTVLLDYETTN